MGGIGLVMSYSSSSTQHATRRGTALAGFFMLGGPMLDWFLYGLTRGENSKVLAWTDRHDMVAVTFPGFVAGGEMLDPFFNANTPEDMAVAQAVLEEIGA